MKLSTQTHFSHGWRSSLLKDVESLDTDMIRDSIQWSQVETKRGRYDFDHRTVTWLHDALADGVEVILAFHPANKLYDGGDTIHSAKGLAAFADFIVAVLKEFPGVAGVEIGNEFNANSMVDGVVADGGKDLRDDYYLKIIAAVDEALEDAGIATPIIGASTHSIPVDYFSALKDVGALDHADAISIHPYTTEPEQLADQLAVLRQVVGQDKVIHVTEFGGNFATLEEAPAYLAKMVAVMAEAGVASANWYAFASQSHFPNMELWDTKADKATPAGETFKIIEALLEQSTDVDRVDIDSYTYFYTFGSKAAILWGEGRDIELAKGVTAYDLSGKAIADLSQISPDVPVILHINKGNIADGVTFGESALLADSFHDFDLAYQPGDDGVWSYHAERGTGVEFDLGLMAGGHNAGEPWTPYLGTKSLRPLQIGSETLVPVDFTPNRSKAKTEYSTIERYTAKEDGTVTIKGLWDVDDHTDDGVLLTIEVNNKAIFSKVIYDKANGHVFDLELTGIELSAGDQVDFEISSRKNASGDVVDRRIQIFDEEVLEAQSGKPEREEPDNAPVPPPVEEAPDLNNTPPENSESNVLDFSDAKKAVTVKGSSDGDVLIGGAGNDKLLGKDGADSFIGGAGKDKIFADGDDIYFDGGEGLDQLFVTGNKGLAVDLGAASIESARGSSGDDYFDGGSLGANAFLKGGDGEDTLIGGSGKDKLFGDDGDDLLEGGAGNDRLQGGDGADIFLFDDGFGRDLILDFGEGDLIDLSRINGVDDIGDISITYAKGRAFVRVGDDRIQLNDVGVDSLDASDFLF